MPLVALTRPVSPLLARCELTHLARQPINVDRARDQHGSYEECLRTLGCEVRRLSPEAELPDAVFVEDIAVVFDEVAMVARPGAASRRPEIQSVAQALAAYRPLFCIEAPGTLDGGDVLVVGRTVFIGLSSRTNEDAIAQAIKALAPFGYDVQPLPVSACLHLKTAVTRVAPRTVLLNPLWVSPGAFAALERIEVDPVEPFAANCLEVEGTVVAAAAFPRTRERLERHGLSVRAVELSELAKAEGAVTCCSLIFELQRKSGTAA